MIFDDYFYKNHGKYHTDLKLWKNNWSIFDGSKDIKKNSIKHKPRFKLNQKLLNDFRKIVGGNTISKKIRSYKDILSQI